MKRALCLLILSSCAHMQGAGPKAAQVTLCASQTVLVQEASIEGAPVLHELREQLRGAMEQAMLGEPLTADQMLALDRIERAIQEIENCL